MKWVAHLLVAAVVLGLLWATGLLIEAELITLPVSGTAIFSVLLTALFLLAGPLTGTAGIFLVSLLREALATTPPGRMLFATATVGLLLLHLSRIERWSVIGRGLVMSGLAASMWALQLGFFQQTQTAEATLNWSALFQNACLTGLAAAGVWLAASVLTTGLRTVWRETATRPIRFGNHFD